MQSRSAPFNVFLMPFQSKKRQLLCIVQIRKICNYPKCVGKGVVIYLGMAQVVLLRNEWLISFDTISLLDDSRLTIDWWSDI